MTHIEEVKDLILSKMAALLQGDRTDVIELGRLAEIYKILNVPLEVKVERVK